MQSKQEKRKKRRAKDGKTIIEDSGGRIDVKDMLAKPSKKPTDYNINSAVMTDQSNTIKGSEEKDIGFGDNNFISFKPEENTDVDFMQVQELNDS